MNTWLMFTAYLLQQMLTNGKKSFKKRHFHGNTYTIKKLLNDFIEELFLYNTPQVFVLDKDKRIVAKDIMPEAVLMQN